MINLLREYLQRAKEALKKLLREALEYMIYLSLSLKLGTSRIIKKMRQ